MRFTATASGFSVALYPIAPAQEMRKAVVPVACLGGGFAPLHGGLPRASSLSRGDAGHWHHVPGGRASAVGRSPDPCLASESVRPSSPSWAPTRVEPVAPRPCPRWLPGATPGPISTRCATSSLGILQALAKRAAALPPLPVDGFRGRLRGRLPAGAGSPQGVRRGVRCWRRHGDGRRAGRPDSGCAARARVALVWRRPSGHRHANGVRI